VPIIVSAFVGGIGPGVVSTASAVAGLAYELFVGGHTVGFGPAGALLRLASLGVVGVLVCGLSEAMRRARRQAHADGARRRATEAALRASEERWKFALDGAGHGVWDWNAVTNRVFFSRQWKAMLGYAEDEIGDSLDEWATRVHPDDRAACDVELEAHLTGRTPVYRNEHRVRCKDGRYRWVLDQGRVVEWTAAGKPLRVIGTHTDIDLRVRTEAALRRSEETLRRAQAVARIGSWFMDFRTGEGWCSAEACSILDVAPWVRFPSPRFVARVHRDDRLGLASAWRDALTGAPFDGEYRLVIDGAERWAKVQAEVKFDTSLEPIEVLGTVHDVTERKRTEVALVRAQKLAALGTMAAGVAHDFNNILLAIVGNAKLAGRDLALDHPAQASLGEILKAGERATELVRRIMTFARGEEEQRDVVALGPVLASAVRLIRTALPAMIDVRVLGTTERVQIAGKSGQIEQVLVNLAMNAAEAIGPQAGAVNFRLEVVDVSAHLADAVPGLHPGEYACLAVSDTGCGMDRATLGRIFDPFFTTKARGRGTGLGLAVVHGIVTSHGGAVAVDSDVSKGTTFRLYFPALAVQAAGAVAADGLAAAEPVRGHGQRILYVDDDDALVLLMTRVLERLGYVVVAWNDATRALEEFRASPHDVDIVVTDLAMPGLSGFELSRRLRAVRADVPIVLTSGYVRKEDEAAARELGIESLILKPHTADALGAEIDRVLHGRQVRPASRGTEQPVEEGIPLALRRA